MNDSQFRLDFQTLQHQIAALQKEKASTSQKIDAVLEDLQIVYEQMQTRLEAAEVVEEGLHQQNQRLTESYDHYYDLFQTSPIAYCVTDTDGVILEANQPIAQLLNVPQRYMAGKPLILYVAEADHSRFRANLNQLSPVRGLQYWQISLCPRQGEPFVAEFHVATVRNDAGAIESLRIGVYNLSRYQQTVLQRTPLAQAQTAETVFQRPHSLDGLQVLIVDDEVDAREFITAVLETSGIQVMAVATTAAALEALGKFHPDVLISDIRMPDDDGYTLIRKVRELEVRQGWHIPAAALTAHIDESQEKTLSAGFEAHLHKLAQPIELIQLVAQLAGRAGSAED
jgi:PAS domain S-box-containing protein